MSHKIKLKIKNGKIESVVEGIAGLSCEQASAWLDRLGDVETDEFTEEAFVASSTMIEEGIE